MKTSFNETAPKGTEGFKFGSLKLFATYARYLVRTVQAYSVQGIRFFGLTLQNEPLNEPNDYPVMRMSAKDQIKLVQMLGPLMYSSGFGDVRIMSYDHNWDVPEYPMEVLKDSVAYQYVAGSAFHCYAGNVSAQSKVHDAYPFKEIYFTECSGTGPSNFKENIPWSVQNVYIGAIENWSTTAMYWNLMLDEDYKPHHGGCSDCRGFVRIARNFTWVDYNEEYYMSAHFGKFLRSGTMQRLGSYLESPAKCLYATAMGDNENVQVVLLNNCSHEEDFVIQRGNTVAQATVPVGLSTFYYY